MAIINTRGTTTVSDDIAIQYVTVGGGAAVSGMTACALPADQVPHMESEVTVSVQLNTAAPYDAALGVVDVYGWSWQGLMTETPGAINAGDSAYGAFVQDLTAATLALPAGGNPATVDSDVSQCTYGPYTDWSACSAACSIGGGATTGTQVQYEPILTFPTPVTANSCRPLAERSRTRACTPTASCTTCENLAKDGVESDIDCGGGVADTFPPGATLGDVAASVQQSWATASANGAHAVATTPSASDSSCSRCNDGRTCTVHSDCNANAGLLCSRDVCTPFWFIRLSWFVDFTVTLNGIDTTQLSGGAWNIYKMTVAEVASGNGVTVSFWNVSAHEITYLPGGVAPGGRRVQETDVRSALEIIQSRKMGRQTLEMIQARAAATGPSGARPRRLASPDDVLEVHTSIGAASEADAGVIAANIQ